MAIEILIYFTQRPIKIIKNLKTQLELADVNNIITVDLKILNHIKPFNNKAPYKIIAVNTSGQKINILYFEVLKGLCTISLILVFL